MAMKRKEENFIEAFSFGWQYYMHNKGINNAQICGGKNREKRRSPP